MKSAVWSAPLTVHIVDHPTPVPAANEAIVKVLFCGLCGSDVDEYLRGPVVAVAPVVLGHEFSGVVIAAAADGSGPPADTLVVVDVVVGCGHCEWCLRHEEGLCPDLVVIGQHVDGGLQEMVAARAERLIPVPPSVSALEAALAEPVAVAVRALRKAGDLRDRSLVVLGGGSIGMLVAQAAVAGGAGRVTVVEPNPERRKLIEGWGIDAVWSVTPSARADLIRARSGGAEPRIVIECSGRTGMIAEALQLVGPAGLVLALGVNAEPEPIDALGLVLAEKTLRGSAAHMWDTDVTDAVALIADKRIDVLSLVTRVFPLDSVAEAFEVAAGQGGSVVKVVVDCS